MRRIKAKLYGFLARAIHAAERALEPHLRREREKDLIRRFASCGSNPELYFPLQIHDPGRVKIGNDVSLNAFVHIWGTGGVTIGDRVMIASHVALNAVTHDYTVDPMRWTVVEREIVIEDDVWIGSHAVINPGVTLHKGCVIGAGAVVTRDVPANAIAAGVPARVLRYRNVEGGTE